MNRRTSSSEPSYLMIVTDGMFHLQTRSIGTEESACQLLCMLCTKQAFQLSASTPARNEASRAKPDIPNAKHVSDHDEPREFPRLAVPPRCGTQPAEIRGLI